MTTGKLNLKIRKIKPQDIPVLVKYRLLFLTELQGKNSDISNNITLKSELEEYFQKALAQNRVFGYIAETNNEPLSFGIMIIKEIPGDFKQSTYLEGDILNMYTVPQARNQGISSIILEKLIEEAKTRGISKVALHASKDGENIYRKFGFSEPKYPYLEMVINSGNFTH